MKKERYEIKELVLGTDVYQRDSDLQFKVASGAKFSIFSPSPPRYPDRVHYDKAKSVCEVEAVLCRKWDLFLGQQKMAKGIPAPSKLGGICWLDRGNGVLNTLRPVGRQIPLTGGNSNYFRKRQGEGRPKVPLGLRPNLSGLAMKIVLKTLDDGADRLPPIREILLTRLTNAAANARVCGQFVGTSNFLANAGNTRVPDWAKFAQPEFRMIFTRRAYRDEGGRVKLRD